MSAVRAGYYVRAGDLFADVDLARVCVATRIADYPRGLPSFVAARKSDGWMYTGALENHPRILRRLARVERLLGNAADVVRVVRDPAVVARVLTAEGVQCPRNSNDPPTARGDGHWLHKPRRSAGGDRIALFDHAACGRGSIAPGTYFQQYVDGLACSGVYLAAGGESRLLGLTRQLVGQPWAGASDFAYSGSLWPLEAPPSATAEFERIGEVLAARFGLVGLFGVDAILNSRGVWPVEVNPRYTASMELLDWGHGTSLVKLHVAACQSGTLPQRLPPPRPAALGKAIVFATADTVVGDGFEQHVTRRLPGDWPSLADVPAAGTRIQAGRPIATVMAAGSDQRGVLRELRRAAESARVAVSA